MEYSQEERIEIVAIYLRNNECANARVRVLNPNNPNKDVIRQYITLNSVSNYGFSQQHETIIKSSSESLVSHVSGTHSQFVR